MKVAIVHDWLNGMRGGERVLEAMLDLWPQATIFTLFYEPDKVSERIRSHTVQTSFLDRIPGKRRHYHRLLPLFPKAIEALDLGQPDLVISSSHAVAKGADPRGAPHICYCHTPMRYIWDGGADYAMTRAERAAMRVVGPRLRSWDRRTAARVDGFAANSTFVGDRIRAAYGRDSVVIHPPVDVDRFTGERKPEDFYLWVGALVRYKKPELAVKTIVDTRRRLIVAGDGPERQHLEMIARHGVEFRGWVSHEELASLYSRARGVIFPGREDFGIVAAESAAAGCPVIAFNGGGALDFLIDTVNACLFDTQTPESLADALDRFERRDWPEEPIRRSVRELSRERFRSEFEQFVRRVALSRRERGVR